MLDKHWGEKGEDARQTSRRREAKSHIWHHHGGSLENQLSGKYNYMADSIKELELAEENNVVLQVKVRLRSYINM